MRLSTRNWLFAGAVCSLLAATKVLAIEDSRSDAVESTCAESSMQFHEIRINTGVMTEKAVVSAPVTTLAIPFVRSDGEYLRCLETHGRNPRVEKIAYFQDADRCRRAASAKPRMSIVSANNSLLTSSFNADEYARCMRREERKVDVEIISQ